MRNVPHSFALRKFRIPHDTLGSDMPIPHLSGRNLLYRRDHDVELSDMLLRVRSRTGPADCSTVSIDSILPPDTLLVTARSCSRPVLALGVVLTVLDNGQQCRMQHRPCLLDTGSNPSSRRQRHHHLPSGFATRAAKLSSMEISSYLASWPSPSLT